MKLRKVLSFVLLLCLLTAAIPAFASAEDAEKVVLKVYYSSPELYPGWEYGDDPVSGYIEDAAGVDIQYTFATTSNHQELYVMLAAGTIEDYDIVFTNGTYIPALVDEGYALALDEIADEYDWQAYYDLLPSGLLGAHGIDGHLYYSVSHYGDANLLANVVSGKKAPTNFTVNYDKVVNELGVEDHSLSTLEDVKNVALLAKENGVNYPLFLSCTGLDNPLHDLSWSQTMNACYAGPGFVYPQADGTVTFNYKSEEYKKGLKWLNEMYRLGLVQADNFTFTASVNDESVKAIALAGDCAFIIGHTWTIEQHLADYMNYRRWKLVPAGEGVDPADIKVTDWNSSQVGSTACFIMDSTEHPLECLKWITTYWQPDIQVACLYGFEGTHYTMDYTYDAVNGDKIVSPQLLEDQANMTSTDFQKKYGFFNNCISSFRGRYGQVYFDRPTKVITNEDGTETIMGDYDVTLGPIYGTPFKTGNLTINFTDSDQQLLLTNLKKTWTDNLPNIVLADTDEEFEAAYQTLCNEMEKVGMAEMEGYLTERYWKYADELGEIRNAKWEAAVDR